jgi:hypothetical protein
LLHKIVRITKRLANTREISARYRFSHPVNLSRYFRERRRNLIRIRPANVFPDRPAALREPRHIEESAARESRSIFAARFTACERERRREKLWGMTYPRNRAVVLRGGQDNRPRLYSLN